MNHVKVTFFLFWGLSSFAPDQVALVKDKFCFLVFYRHTFVLAAEQRE